mmetsp:Transcript_32885/g.85389  ORF Transcript_32885/g.85389 Transcript_32885/m.85389 type:complete len:280 (+) Transcript_32885:2325-3164(+)
MHRAAMALMHRSNFSRSPSLSTRISNPAMCCMLSCAPPQLSFTQNSGTVVSTTPSRPIRHPSSSHMSSIMDTSTLSPFASVFGGQAVPILSGSFNTRIPAVLGEESTLSFCKHTPRSTRAPTGNFKMLSKQWLASVRNSRKRYLENVQKYFFPASRPNSTKGSHAVRNRSECSTKPLWETCVTSLEKCSMRNLPPPEPTWVATAAASSNLPTFRQAVRSSTAAGASMASAVRNDSIAPLKFPTVRFRLMPFVDSLASAGSPGTGSCGAMILDLPSLALS